MCAILEYRHTFRTTMHACPNGFGSVGFTVIVPGKWSCPNAGSQKSGALSTSSCRTSHFSLVSSVNQQAVGETNKLYIIIRDSILGLPSEGIVDPPLSPAIGAKHDLFRKLRPEVVEASLHLMMVSRTIVTFAGWSARLNCWIEINILFEAKHPVGLMKQMTSSFAKWSAMSFRTSLSDFPFGRH